MNEQITTAEHFAPLARAMARSQQERQQKIDTTAMEMAIDSLAPQFSAADGFTGRDAEVFELAFRGAKIKAINPRAEGREVAFRAGRAARVSEEGQRAIRATWPRMIEGATRYVGGGNTPFIAYDI